MELAQSIVSPIAHLPKHKKYALFESITPENREIYFLLSEFPISREAEDDMELLSDIVTWGEIFNPVFQKGIYTCARCDNKLYCSEDKWKGPCVWPSFRKAITAESVFSVDVAEYNGYSCTVRERYCGICKLFLGHQFEDGIIKGDTHPDARWRE